MGQIKTGVLSLLLTLALPLTAAAEAQDDFTAAGKKFQKSQSPPISLGTSGGNALDFEISGNRISCSSGTLGALIEKNGVQYVLSNNHVMAMQNQAEKGDPINQPGLIDEKPLCDFTDDRVVAELTGWKKLKFGGVKKNKVDAAIAEVRDGMVKSDGTLIKIGQPGNEIMDPVEGLDVKKAGRSTGVTRATVVATNVSATVDFSSAGNLQQQDARFVGQFLIDGGGKEIYIGGDSGAVFYEDVKTCPRAVGLGFAGNAGGDLALASPMKQVLKAMKKVKPKGTATMVGCDPVGSAGGFAASAAVDFWDDRDAEVRVAQRVQRRNERAILELPEVAAIGVGRGSVDRDELVFKVFVTDADSGRYIPERVEGIRTEIVVSGRFYAK